MSSFLGLFCLRIRSGQRLSIKRLQWVVSQSRCRLTLMTPTGAPLHGGATIGEGIRADFNPTGTSIAAFNDDYTNGQYVYSVNLKTPGYHSWDNSISSPIWSPDSRRLAVQCHMIPGGPMWSLCLVNSDGSGSPSLVKAGDYDNQITPLAWRAG